MERRQLLMTPGPTMVPARALMAASEAMIHHRTTQYGEIFKKANKNLQEIFQTKNPVITFPSSGTGGLEASTVNFFSPGDRVLCVSIGVFGDRVARIAEIFGLEVEKLSVEWGRGVDPEIVADRLKSKDYKGIFITHNETSTGANNDLEAIGQLVKDKDTLLIVDAVSSLGGLDIQTDNWGLDVVVAASQKAIMSAPGLAFLSVSQKARRAAQASTMPKYYWDVLKALEAMEKPLPQNPYTPAVSLIKSTNVAMEMILQEGLDNVFNRHGRLASALQAGIEALGLELFAEAEYRSNVVTSVLMPEGINGDDLRKIISDKYGVIIAGGQQRLKGKIIRIGHMGYVAEGDIIETMAALERGLKIIGYPVEIGWGVKRVLQTLGIENT